MSKAICSVKTPGCTYLGINATEKISGILEKENAKKVIVLTDRGVYDTGLPSSPLMAVPPPIRHFWATRSSC